MVPFRGRAQYGDNGVDFSLTRIYAGFMNEIKQLNVDEFFRSLSVVFGSMTPRERKVILMREGINIEGTHHTLEESEKWTWMDILGEEVLEAVVETDPARQREELIQVLAVGVQMVEAIDRRKKDI